MHASGPKNSCQYLERFKSYSLAVMVGEVISPSLTTLPVYVVQILLPATGVKLVNGFVFFHKNFNPTDIFGQTSRRH